VRRRITGALLGVLLLASAGAFQAGRLSAQQTPPAAPEQPPTQPPGVEPPAEPEPRTNEPKTLPKPPEVKSRKGFSIKITNPITNDFRYGKSQIEAEVKSSDPGAVEKVEFFVEDKLIFIDTEAPYRCVFDFGTEPRSWILRAVAHHREGVTVSDQVILKKVILNYAVQVNRVILYATAMAAGKNYVLDLTRGDLLLEEDGVRQEIVDFYREERPVTLAVVSDSSGSMQAAMKTVHAAASRFLDALGPEDKALVIDFDDKVYLLQDVTANRDDLRLALTSTNALGGTALYDALYASYRKLKGIDGRKAIILLSDGDDTSSKFSFRRVLDEAKINDFIIYTIGLGTSFMDVDLRRILKSLAEETGGRAYFPDKVDELEGVYQQIAAELKSQYYITYEPSATNWDGRWRKIRLAAPKKGVEIRTRSGYYAVRKSG
jgi:Ca-activated chloride channel family protein